AYNQQRLNDINGANLKLFLTHVGLDVGEDGATHQCIDYVKNTKFGEESSSFVFDEDGTVIGHPTLESGSSLPSVMPAFWEAFQKEKANLTGGSIVNLFYGSGKDSAMAAEFPVKWLNSYVALSLTESQIVAPLLSKRTKMMLWGLP
ncbi:hypothetical protein, partial [Acetomicrobium sp. S15 = DSM 107314]|uniref:hypothetical protein n=1 Tax=Acetomicrobium sp. S15 = DSM 107314 TaxID=2529858 RepID=UPI0018E0C95A